MRKIVIAAVCGLLFSATQSVAQRFCGTELFKAAMIAKDPAAEERLEQQRNSLQPRANKYKQLQINGAAAKTTAVTNTVPVIFHIIVNETQFNQLGGYEGIAKRCDSQIAVLNRDFNRENPDSVQIPAWFKPFYGSSGIKFGLAHTAPWGNGSTGYDVRIISNAGFNGITNSYADAKHNSSGGLDAWDVSRYLNIWCINFSDMSGLLGLTGARSMIGASLAADEIGVCLLYNALGKRSSATDSYPGNFDLGRTLTHELGHFFEIWHTWGDDGGLCPGTGGVDDGIADTPPQANNSSGAPTGHIYDACSGSTTDGIMYMNFMDYTDDRAMHMFTIDQAAAMFSQIAPGGGNHTLVQNDSLLLWSPTTAVSNVSLERSINMFPNPTTGVVDIMYDNDAALLNSVTVANVMGLQVLNVQAADKRGHIVLELNGNAKGIYFVTCNFASGSVTRKILLQ